MVYPAEFDVGAHDRSMVCSVTEGDDTPLKYPMMFRSVDLVLVTKMDLVPHLDIDVALLERHIGAVNPEAELTPATPQRPTRAPPTSMTRPVRTIALSSVPPRD